MHPTNVAVIICSAIVGLIRIAMGVKTYRGFGLIVRGNDPSPWSDPVVLAPLAEVVPLLPCLASIAVASCGLTKYGLSTQWATFSTLSIVDLIGAKQWLKLLPKLGHWQKAGVWIVVLLSLAGAGTAAGLPTIYTPFALSLVFSIVYAYITEGSFRGFRWCPYLVFTLLLFVASIALGVLVFGYKMSQLSDYLFLSLNLLHPRTVHGFISWWKDPSEPNQKLKLRSPSNSTSTLNKIVSRSSSTPTPPQPIYNAKWVTEQYHCWVQQEHTGSPYYYYGGKGKGFLPDEDGESV